MIDKQQRRKDDNNNKSRIPIPSNRHIATTLTNGGRNTVVTPAKLESTKNNRHQHTSACSRSLKEANNYRKTKTPINNDLRYKNTFTLPSVIILKKQPTKNIRIEAKKLTAMTTITASIKSRTKNTVTQINATTTTTTANMSKLTPRRKSPLTLLKEDLGSLREQNSSDESLIQSQHSEISRLKEALKQSKVLTSKRDILAREMRERKKIEEKLVKVEAQTKDLSTEIVDLLEIKSACQSSDASNSFDCYKQEIETLQLQLKAQQEAFEKKISEYQSLIEETNATLQLQKEQAKKLKLEHQKEINQLKAAHNIHIQKLESQHKASETVAVESSSLTVDANELNDAIEKILQEFEQDQYGSHIIKPSSLLFSRKNELLSKDKNEDPSTVTVMSNTTMKNQQWYANKYMPIDALSWPSPQSVFNARRQQQQHC